jgi:hypothetical protein
VERALRTYQNEHEGTWSDDSKLLLVMRVAFDLPESGSRGHWDSFGGWRDWSDYQPDAKMTVAWPLSWHNGDPQFVVGFTALQGKRYDAAGEYHYFLAKYPLRPLASFSK